MASPSLDSIPERGDGENVTDEEEEEEEEEGKEGRVGWGLCTCTII